MLQSHPIALLLVPFETVFTKPTWRKVLILLEGTLLAHGRRTVTAALRAMGLQGLGQFNVYHHVLNRARWSPMQLPRFSPKRARSDLCVRQGEKKEEVLRQTEKCKVTQSVERRAPHVSA